MIKNLFMRIMCIFKGHDYYITGREYYPPRMYLELFEKWNYPLRMRNLIQNGYTSALLRCKKCNKNSEGWIMGDARKEKLTVIK